MPAMEAVIVSSLLGSVYYFLKFTLCRFLCVLFSMMNFKMMVNSFSSSYVTSYILNGNIIPGNLLKCGVTITCPLLILLPFLWFCNRSLILTRNAKWLTFNHEMAHRSSDSSLWGPITSTHEGGESVNQVLGLAAVARIARWYSGCYLLSSL